MLGRWQHADEAKQDAVAAGNRGRSMEQDELRQLRNEVQRLRMEREVLKKALCDFASEWN